MKKGTWIFLLFVIMTATILLGTSLWQYEPYRIFEYLSLTKNSLEVSLNELDKREYESLRVFWRGQKESLSQNDKIRKNYYDTLLIYEGGKSLQSIPDRYGKSGLIIEYCGIKIHEPGLYKFREWYKHDYVLDIVKESDTLMISWEIKNWYESKKGEVSKPFSIQD